MSSRFGIDDRYVTVTPVNVSWSRVDVSFEGWVQAFDAGSIDMSRASFRGFEIELKPEDRRMYVAAQNRVMEVRP